MNIEINSPEEKELIEELEKRPDPEAKRLLRYLGMPDLSRTPGNPIAELVQRILNIAQFSGFDDIRVPEIVSTEISFDLFDFPLDHPVRQPTDTYYPAKDYILRTHTTVMWYYWLKQSRIKERIKNKESLGSFCYGKVYRKDEIDRSHMPVFHQMDGWYLAPKEQRVIASQDLQEVLASIAKAIFGPDIKYRFNQDQFPYTNPSLEMEVDKDGQWLEVLGAGVVKGSVLDKLGVDSSQYNGWAFGFGLERLAMISMSLPDIRLLWSQDERVKRQLKLGNKYREVSKYPPITRDVSFIVKKDFVPNNYFDLIRDIGGDLVEEVKLLDSYESPEKFGPDKMSYTYRITYRSNERTLTTEEIDPIQEKIYQETAEIFGAQMR